jgi:hypothetical protein
MIIRFASIAVAAIITINTAQADDGEKLLGDCTQQSWPTKIDDRYSYSWCLGFIHGVVAGFDMGRYSLVDLCIPKNTKISELKDVIVFYLRRHPSDLNEDAIVLMATAWKEKWPCSKKEKEEAARMLESLRELRELRKEK